MGGKCYIDVVMVRKSEKSIAGGLHALIWKEGKWYVARCVEVEVASQGKTGQEARVNLEEAVSLYFAGEKVVLPNPLPELKLQSPSVC